MPLALAFAITVHKSKGLTLERAVIDLETRENKEGGITYVALSRLKTFEGLFLQPPIWPFNKSTTVSLQNNVLKEKNHGWWNYINQPFQVCGSEKYLLCKNAKPGDNEQGDALWYPKF